MRAIELNGVAVEANKQAFLWGRRAAVDLQQVERVAIAGASRSSSRCRRALDALVARRVAFLTEYQNAAYAKRYEALVDKVRRAEAQVSAGDALTQGRGQVVLQAHGLQGRVRGRAPLHRRRLREAI